MPTYYFDTSAVVKHYHQEAGAAEVHRIITDPTAVCIVSRLTLTEVQRAFARRARTQAITADELGTLRRVLYQDLQERHLCIERMHEYHHHTAVRLFLKYWGRTGVPLLRTADALPRRCAPLACPRQFGLFCLRRLEPVRHRRSRTAPCREADRIRVIGHNSCRE